MILSLPPFSVNVFSSSIIIRMPLHFTKETRKSISLQERISCFNSLSILGSATAPVNKELSAIEVTGRFVLCFLCRLRGLFILERSEEHTSELQSRFDLV